MHEEFMRRALLLAEKAKGATSPNPMVGAVLVKNGRIIAEGFHRKAGGPHAEVIALKKAGTRAKGATLYVTLEPCCHSGRTPPCTEKVIASGVQSVVVGMRDPNPLVSGKGIRALKRAGIKVVTGVLKKECLEQNEFFIKYITEKTPFVISKAALSLDGKIATASGESQWITGPKARRKVHELRNEVDAILVGTGTVLKDNPRLTVRMGKKPICQPARVVIDVNHKVPLTARVWLNANVDHVICVVGKNIPAKRKNALERFGVQVWSVLVKDRRADLKALMKKLAEAEITSVLIEGGGELNADAFQSGIVDKVLWFVAPVIIGGNRAPGVLGGSGVMQLKRSYKLKRISVSPVGPDLLVEGYL